jgi:hypothetical protein
MCPREQVMISCSKQLAARAMRESVREKREKRKVKIDNDRVGRRNVLCERFE